MNEYLLVSRESQSWKMNTKIICSTPEKKGCWGGNHVFFSFKVRSDNFDRESVTEFRGKLRKPKPKENQKLKKKMKICDSRGGKEERKKGMKF